MSSCDPVGATRAAKRYQKRRVPATKKIWYHDGEMTAIYQQAGIQFLYPENWELDNREDSGQPWSVSVHSPSGGFWSLTVHEGETELADLSAESLQAVEQEYQDSFFEAVPTREMIAGHATIGFDINFFYLDFLIFSKLRVFRMGRYNCIVLYQAEDRDFDQLDRVFQAITLSLFAEAKSTHTV